MIGYLCGRVQRVANDRVIIVCGGVGYQVRATALLLSALVVGQEIECLVETEVSEHDISLFGFATSDEQTLYRAMRAYVKGVGSKSAMSLLSGGSHKLVAQVMSGDEAGIAKNKGVGPAVAKRVVAELGAKLASLELDRPAEAQHPERVGILASLKFMRIAPEWYDVVMREEDALSLTSSDFCARVVARIKASETAVQGA